MISARPACNYKELVIFNSDIHIGYYDAVLVLLIRWRYKRILLYYYVSMIICVNDIQGKISKYTRKNL